ncbi:MAG: DUF2313 domain-containing protein [Lachnospiraceae bacterium]|nr:DUF2313 domain-containing protein [Lachnospiraceae bacterium]
MELIKLLPDYYDKNETMQLLQEILSAETDKTDRNLNQAVDQCFVESATIGLARYENMLGLEIDFTKSDRYRRERISAKVSGAGTTTKEMIIDVASQYSNGDVEVVEDNANNIMIIKFVGTLGIPGNMSNLKLTIEEIKPAHLKVEYEYTYRTWNDVARMTWEEASLYTWEDLRVVKNI